MKCGIVSIEIRASIWNVIPRPGFAEQVGRALALSPVVAILGPRQCGKTTLARNVVVDIKHTWFDLEDPVNQRQLEAPELTLPQAEHLVVLDEIQLRPELFPLLRVLVDQQPNRRFLILGSASPDLRGRSAESLAGRIDFVELAGFLASEVDDSARLWLRGGFPRSYLAATDEQSLRWRESFIRTFLERDLRQLEVRATTTLLRRFWTMVAHYHAQTWNGADFARSLDISPKTARNYLDLLEGTFVVRQLPPWLANVGKRLVKAPKTYVRDTGLLHGLLALESYEDLMGHPKAGASWEGYALEHVLAHLKGQPYFWGTHQGAELDLLLLRRRQRWGFEFKLSAAPKLTKSMRIAADDLKLDHLWVVHPGESRIPLRADVTAIPLSDVAALEERGMQ